MVQIESTPAQRGAPWLTPWFRPAAAAVLVFAIGIRLIGIGSSLWIDEAGSVAQATSEHFWAAARSDVHPPLYFLLLRCGLRLTHSFTLLRLFSVGFGVGLVAAAIACFRRTPVAAIALGVILAGLPELVRQSQQLRPYALLFLLLGLALMVSIRIASGEGTRANAILLSAILAAAAATHVGTAFFLLALAPVVAWPVLRSGPRAVALSWVPLVPAGILLLWLEFGFLQSPAGLPEGWWIPRAGPGQVAASLSEATGWTEVVQFADDASRHIAGAGALIRLAGVAAAGLCILGAWGRRRAEPLAVLLLVSGLVYISALVGCSLVSEPLVIGRTLVPGLLPVAAGIALGVARNPGSLLRRASLLAITVFFLLASEHGIRRAFAPDRGLRELAAGARSRCGPGDQLILLRAMDYGLKPYWADLNAARPLLIDQTQPIDAQLAALRARLDSLGPSARVFVIYRDDFYLHAFPTQVSAILTAISGRGFALRETWHEDDLLMLEGARQKSEAGTAR